jgi:hypothetical protein
MQLTVRNVSQFVLRLGMGAIAVAALIAVVAPTDSLSSITAALLSGGVPCVMIGGTIFWWSKR